MDTDLAYYRRRVTEERDAAAAAVHPKAIAVHRELAQRYYGRIAALEATLGAPLHLVA